MNNLKDLIKYIQTDPLPTPFKYQGVNVTSLKAQGDKTFCNEAVWYVSTQMGCKLFGLGMMANQMVTRMEEQLNEVLAQEAMEWANKGNLAIAGKRYDVHGHVAIISPSTDLYKSGSWNRLVPYVTNVGETNGIMPVSKAFPVAQGEPSYFIWRP